MKKIWFILLMVMGIVALASAQSFVVENTTGNVFTVSNLGAVNASGTIAESGTLLSNTYCKLSGCTMTGNLDLTGKNVTASYFFGSGLYLTGLNASLISTGTIPFANLPTLTNTHLHDYHNITSIPTCGAGTHLFFNGIDLSCTADATSSADFTNVAFINITNIFAETQLFSKDLNITGNITMKTNNTGIRWDSGTFIYKDNTGNLRIRLGG